MSTDAAALMAGLYALLGLAVTVIFMLGGAVAAGSALDKTGA